MIRFRCTKCGAGIRVGDDSAGRQGECPQCGTILTIPTPTAGPPARAAAAIRVKTPAAGSATMAKVALVLGILAVIPFLGGALALTAVILGIVVLVSPRSGKGMAVLGMALGLVLSTAGTVVVIVYLLMPAAVKVRAAAQRASCAARLEMIGVAARQYAAQNEGTMPANLHDLVSEELIAKTDLLCPSVHDRAVNTDGDYQGDYVYQQPVEGTDADPQTIIACDRKGNHTGGRCVLFVSGSAQWMADPQFEAELDHDRNWAFAMVLRGMEAESIRLPARRGGAADKPSLRPRRPSWPSKGR